MKDLESFVAQAQSGNPTAYGAVVRLFQDMAVGYSYSILGDFHLAEDAAQEAFAKAYASLGQLEEPAAFPGWFRRIVFTCCDRFRRGRQPPSVPLDFDIASGDPRPDEIAESKDESDQIRRAIQTLPEDERRAVTLFYISGFSHKEVGEFLGEKPATIKSRLHTARRKLRTRMTRMIEKELRDNRPSYDDRLADKVVAQRLGALIEERARDAARLIEDSLATGPELADKIGILMDAIGPRTAGPLQSALKSSSRDVLTWPRKKAPGHTALEVMEEFERLLMARKYVGMGGVDFARGALSKIFGPRKAEALLNQAMKSSGLYRLRGMDVARVAELVSGEPPLSAAVVLLALDGAQAIRVFHELPEPLRSDVVLRLDQAKRIDSATMQQIDDQLCEKL